MLAPGALSAQPARANLAPGPLTKADLVVVYKSERILELQRTGRVLKTFPIALGREPVGTKLREGDGRTPEGVYTLDWRNPYSRFHRAIHISYPRTHDDVRAIRWGVSPGGQIMLHGLPDGVTAERIGHPRRDWTDGCIALTNEEIDEVWARVDDGTTIIIYP
ncbi:MAG TPA: L,D-transpeptidase family protein [Geminicoccaceae bacterium]|nr:L,D-transpeptidase family protein [Geminicoccaceae bacterium]